jgi:hypothetical protein
MGFAYFFPGKAGSRAYKSVDEYFIHPGNVNVSLDIPSTILQKRSIRRLTIPAGLVTVFNSKPFHFI